MTCPACVVEVIGRGMEVATFISHLIISWNPLEESMMTGTVAGEMPALSDFSKKFDGGCRASLGVVEENIQRLQIDEPALVRVFMQLIFKGTLAESLFSEATC
jgi:hypothetical protein